MRLPAFISVLFQSAFRNVHPVANGRQERRTQAWFVLIHCVAGLVLSLAAVVFLALVPSDPSLAVLLSVLGCMALGMSWFLIRSGALYAVRCVSIAAFALLVGWIAGRSGGLNSPALLLFALAIFETARLKDRSLVALALTCAGTTVAVVAAFSGTPVLTGFALTSFALLAYAAATAINATHPRAAAETAKRIGRRSTDVPGHVRTSTEPAVVSPVPPFRARPAMTARPATPVETRISPFPTYGNRSVSSQYCVQEGDCRVR